MRVALLFLLSFYLHASVAVVPMEYIYSKEYRHCMSDSMSSLDALSCIEKERKVQKSIMNERYKEALKSVQKFRRADLVRMQRLWREYVDAKCTFYYHKESGSGGAVTMSDCFLEETTKRAIELDEVY